MEQKVIEKNSEQCIYLINESNFYFYFMIPNCQKVHIGLGIFPEVNDEFVKTIPKQVDKAIVIPIINSNTLEQIHIDSVKGNVYLSNLLSFLINTAYKILTYNHISVDTQIFLHQNVSFTDFNQQFVSKYQGRVQLFDLFPQISTNVSENHLSTQVAMPVDQMLNVEVSEEQIISDSDLNGVSTERLTEVREPGFVSYVLLGVLVAVISLVFLYLVI